MRCIVSCDKLWTCHITYGTVGESSRLTRHCSPIPGAVDRIHRLRERYSRLRSSLSYYEDLSSTQAEQLSKLNKPRDFGVVGEDATIESEEEEIFTKEDMIKEEDELKELERKKKALEERVARMEQDLQF